MHRQQKATAAFIIFVSARPQLHLILTSFQL
jgi:hypothetical protein